MEDRVMATTKRGRAGGRSLERLNTGIAAAERESRGDQTTIRALDKMNRATARPAGAMRGLMAGQPSGREDLMADVKRLCAEYRKWRGTIVSAIEMIARIPFIGAKVAAALRFLVQLLDAICKIVG
jgi:hypothetical protein